MRRSLEVSPPGDGPFLHIGTYLPLKRYRDIPAFIRSSGQVIEQLQRNPAVVRLGVEVRLLSRHFWTYSVWQSVDEDAVQQFVHSGAHRLVLPRVAEWSGGREAFARWTHASASMDWNELHHRLPARR